MCMIFMLFGENEIGSILRRLIFSIESEYTWEDLKPFCERTILLTRMYLESYMALSVRLSISLFGPKKRLERLWWCPFCRLCNANEGYIHCQEIDCGQFNVLLFYIVIEKVNLGRTHVFKLFESSRWHAGRSVTGTSGDLIFIPIFNNLIMIVMSLYAISLGFE